MDIERVILFQIDKTSKLSKLYSQREFDRIGLGITVDQWVLLKIIGENDGLTQKELAAKSYRDPASITRTLDILGKKGLVERRPVPKDRRQYSICLKPEGYKFIETNFPLIQRMRSRSVEGLSEQDLSDLMRILGRIQENFS